MPAVSLRRSLTFLALAACVMTAVATRVNAAPQQSPDPPAISAGAEAYFRMREQPNVARLIGPLGPLSAPSGELGTSGIIGGGGFLGFGFDDNMIENGTFFIPPDPIGAAGMDRVIGVVNTMIESRSKAGVLLWKDSLKDFFMPAAGVGAGVLGTFTFDPKVIYDHYAGRFVVVTIEQTDVFAGGAADASRILLAVSKTGTPASPTAADWHYWSIDSKVAVAGGSVWADYPGFEADEEAVYITMNMFPFLSSGAAFDQRLWIVHKGLVGGFYSGGPATVTIHSPYDATGIPGFKSTTMPAQVFGAGGAGPGVGTYLTSYTGLTFGGPGAPEAINVIRVNSPLGPVSFTQEFITVGDIEDLGGGFGFPAIPDAPQLGGPETIEVNDRRTLDAVWRAHRLYVVTTINPNFANSPPDVGQATAHYFQVSTAAVASGASPAGLLVLAQEGNVGGEDITPGPEPVWTFFPAIAVNGIGQVKIGFSASASSIFGGAYVTGREAADPPGTVQATALVHPGIDYYVRTFDAPPCLATPARNRWGDYSGISNDPADDRVFWVNNEFADFAGSPTAGGCNGRPHPETGRWRTAWGSCAFSCFTVDCPAQNVLVVPGQSNDVSVCINNCGPYGESFSYTVSDLNGWCSAPAGPVVVAGDGQSCVTVTCNVPAGATCGEKNAVTFEVTSSDGTVKSCTFDIQVDCATPTQLAMLGAEGRSDGIRVRWMFGDASDVAAVALQRAPLAEGPWEPVNAEVIAEGQVSTVLDRGVAPGALRYYRLEVTEISGDVRHMGITSARRGGALADGAHLAQPMPNPARFGADIAFTLATPELVRLTIVDAGGRAVRTLRRGTMDAGEHRLHWNATDDDGRQVPAGIYFITLGTSYGDQTRRLAIVH